MNHIIFYFDDTGNCITFRPARRTDKKTSGGPDMTMRSTSYTSVDNIFLITINGQNQPGVVASITTIMARYAPQILDVTQSVIHDTIHWCTLLCLDDRALLDALEHHCQQCGLAFYPQQLSTAEAEHWLSEQVSRRFILTLISPAVTAEQISAVSNMSMRHGFSIEHIATLGGPRYQRNGHLSCLEFTLAGSTAHYSALQAELRELTTQLNADIALQSLTAYRSTRRLVVFDMDSTLIEAEVIDLLAQAHGVGPRVAAITEQAMRGELDFNQSLTERLAMLKGLDESALAEIARQLPLMTGAERLIKTLKSSGYRTAIISGGFTCFARHLQTVLGIDHAYANELEIVGGQLTGRVLGTVVDGQRKAELLRQIAAAEGVSLAQVVAVGDGANDLPMLSIAGLGIAFRAKPLVRREAPQAISTLGLDSILYLLGCNESEFDE